METGSSRTLSFTRINAPFHSTEQVNIFNQWKSRSLLEQEVIIKKNDLLFHLTSVTTIMTCWFQNSGKVH